jgi:Integrase zinc binding domain
LVDTSSGVMRPLVPAPLRRQVFATVHGLALPGIRATRRLVASLYLWPGLAKDIAAWCQDCQACQRAKVTKQPAAAVQRIQDTGVSAAELVYGALLQVPGQFLSSAKPPPADFVRSLNSGVPCVAPLPPAPTCSSSSQSAALEKAAFVYVRSPAAAPALSLSHRGPYAVHKRAAKFFILRSGARFEAVSVDCLKPHLGRPASPADPPRCSRPPGRRGP